MVSYKDKIITIPLFNTCYPQNLAKNLARFFDRIMLTLPSSMIVFRIISWPW
jgi:hypothetical protein